MAEIEHIHAVIRGEYIIGKFHADKKLIHIGDVSNAITEDSISINHFETAHRFIQNFGGLITKMRFSNSFTTFTEEQVEVLNHAIEEFCSSSLVHIELADVGFHLLSDSEKTFSNVVSVYLDYSEYDKDTFELDRIYPMMESLEFHVTYAYNRLLGSIVRPYPQLKHLKFVEQGARLYNGYVKTLIQLNPQLRSLSLNTFPGNEFLDFVSMQLAQLESLEFECNAIDSIRDDNSFILASFPNVKHFKIVSADICPNPIPMKFENLAEVEISPKSAADSPPIRKLLEQNKNAKIL